ncbi:MAG: hypothetical protein EPO23_12225 [Xanthobacteraceae bacterium]|nr:MAG: hypothetical protein EPO23_12225 [Xanthobacteraceae bacterium]
MAAVVYSASAFAQSSSTPSHSIGPLAPIINSDSSTNNAQSPAKVYDTQRNCVAPGEERVELLSGIRPVGDAIVLNSLFLPTGGRTNVGMKAPFVDKTRYFAFIRTDDGKSLLLKRQDVSTRGANEGDDLVQRGLLSSDETLVTLNLDDSLARLWRGADLYLYTCATTGSPAHVSRLHVRLSSHRASLWITLAVLLSLYTFVAYLTRRTNHTLLSFIRSLDPIRLTVGPDGRASLSKLQVLFFSLIVFGLILLLALQTGNLTDISGTVVALLGINGIGATIAKGTDAKRLTISPENRAWLLRKGWITATAPDIDLTKARWSDLITTGQEFDVYRFQSFVFAIVVGFTMIAGGFTQLSAFTIPETILSIVGLSQAVYIGGKLVVPTETKDLNAALDDLRDREKKFRDAATSVKKAPVATLQEAITLAGPNAYDAFLDRARDVSALFTSQTNIAVASTALEPSFS